MKKKSKKRSTQLKSMHWSWPLFFAFFLSALVRGIFLWQWSETPFGQVPFLDAQAYMDSAMSILAGNWVRDGVFYQSPLYPYILALLFAVTGPSLVALGIVQVVLSSVTAALLSYLTYRMFGMRAAWVAGMLAALYKPFVFYSAPALKEVWTLFFLAMFLLLATLAIEKSKRRYFFGAGLLLGLCVLTRSNVLLLAPVAAFYFKKKANWRSIAVFALGLALAILPATLHNWKVARDFVLINAGGGFNFYIGNGPYASGVNDYPPQVSTDPLEEELDTARIASLAHGRPLKASEISDYWMQSAKSHILENPQAALKLFFKKIFYFFNSVERPDNYNINFFVDDFKTILSLPLVNFGLIVVLFVLGVFLAPKSFSKQMLFACAAVYFVSVILFYVTDRYRLPVVVFFIPLAAAGLVELFKNLKSKKLLKPVGCAVVAALIAFWPMEFPREKLAAYSWGSLISLYTNMNEDKLAIQTFEKIPKEHIMGMNSQSFIKLAYSYERLGNLENAQKILDFAVQLFPQNGYVHHNYGVMLFEANKIEGAMERFKQAVQVAPWLHQPWIGLASIYLKQNKISDARVAIHEGLKLKPDSPELLALQERVR